jgi:uncharacterized OB-fold protein
MAAEGYAELSPVRRDQTGAAIRDPRRDPHFASAAGGRALAGRLGGKTVSPSPLLDAVRALENGGKATVVGGGDGAAAAFDVSLTGALPAGPTLAAWEATGRAPSKAEARGAGGPRPRGATGVDPDGALLWRERRELLAPLGAQCASCARVNVPPSGAVLCRRCGGRELSVVELPRQGVVISYATAPRSLPRALPAPSTTIYAELTGGTWWKALGTGYAGGDIAVRDPVELVVRRIALDDGAPIYGLAFRKPLA